MLLNYKEIMPSAAIWMDLEIIILNEVNQAKTNIMNITYMWNLKEGIQMNLVHRTEIDPQTEKRHVVGQAGGRDKL